MNLTKNARSTDPPSATLRHNSKWDFRGWSMAGFGATPDELHKAANAISDTVQKAAELVWQGPSGNYGHPGVQEGWGHFVQDAKAEIQKLTQATKGHGENLVQCAQHYLSLDEQVAGLLGNAAGDAISSIAGGAAQGAHAGSQAGGAAGSTVGGAVGSAVGTAAGAIGGPGVAHAVGEAGGEVGSAVGGAVGSAAGAVGGAAAGAGHAVGSAVGEAVSGGMRMTGNILEGLGGGNGSGIAKEAEL
jgi:hypothetical protein